MKKSTKIILGTVGTSICVGTMLLVKGIRKLYNKDRKSEDHKHDSASDESKNIEQVDDTNVTIEDKTPRIDPVLPDHVRKIKQDHVAWYDPNEDYRLEDHVDNVKFMLHYLYDVNATDYDSVLADIKTLSGNPLPRLLKVYPEKHEGMKQIKLEDPITILDFLKDSAVIVAPLFDDDDNLEKEK